MSFFKNLKVIDVFASDFSILVQGSKKFNTFLGSLATILTSVFILFITISFGDEFYNRKNPKVAVQDRVFSYDDLYKMNNVTALPKQLALRVSKYFDNTTTMVIDTSEPYSFQKNKSYSIMGYCDTEWVLKNFYPDNRDYGVQQMSSDVSYLCYKLDQFKFGLMDDGGGQGSLLVNPISIWTLACGRSYKSVLQSKDCPTGYNAKLNQNVNVEIWMEDILYDQDNVTDPFTQTLTRTTRFYMTKDLLVATFVSLKSYINSDDKGFLLQSLEETSNLGFSNLEYFSANLGSVSSKYELTIYIGYNKIYRKSLRTYMKIQDLLALIGGVFKFIFTTFQILLYFYNEYSVIEYLSNEYNNTPSIQQNRSLLKVALSNADKNINIRMSDKAAEIDISQAQLNKADKLFPAINNFIVSHDQPTKRLSNIGFWNYLLNILGCSSKSIKLALQNYKKGFGIEKILTTQREFSVFKELFLRQEQIIALSLTSGESTIIDNESSFSGQEVFNYFKSQIDGNSLSDIDKTLIKAILRGS